MVSLAKHMIEQEKKLWNCYHARAMQGLLSHYGSAIFADGDAYFSLASRAARIADSMLEIAKRQGSIPNSVVSN